MALLKMGFVFTVLLIAAMNMAWFSETHLVVARNVARDLSGVERRLLSQLNTCFRSCEINYDCNDCWTCCTCAGYPGYKICRF
ncbi:hypothetical protein A4A49_45247 [Nicotiana attenuata]|uniref:Carboxypeptidase A inhibitor-like domain-containing protein n=1 Tax=Nicotiana attenuata TaxID=49451 RepID=A0A1J6IUB4_NICAT|nr:hypothetical protein A4A49_45247 [Nicotiana attenuata]